MAGLPGSKEKYKQRPLGRFIFKISATLVIDRVRDLYTKRIPTKEDAERPCVGKAGKARKAEKITKRTSIVLWLHLQATQADGLCLGLPVM